MEWRQMDGETCAHIQSYTGVCGHKNCFVLAVNPVTKHLRICMTYSNMSFAHFERTGMTSGKSLALIIWAPIMIADTAFIISIIFMWRAAFDSARCSASCFSPQLRLSHALISIWDRGRRHLWQRFNQSAQPWVYRAGLKGFGQVWWIGGGKLRSPAHCSQWNAILPPPIRQTWPKPFSTAL